MKIYFCDICNESIPLKDINSNRITIEEGKIFCQKCAPKKVRSGERIPGSLLGVLGLVVVAILVLGWVGWKLTTEQAGEIRALKTEVATLAGRLEGSRRELAGVPAAVSSLQDSVRRLTDDLATARAELQQRYETLDLREAANHAQQATNMQKAVDKVTSTFGGELAEMRRTLQEVQLAVDRERGEIDALGTRFSDLKDIVTAKAPTGGGGEPPTPEAVQPKTEPSPAGPSLEDREIDAHIAQLQDPDPGKRYSAVIALGRYSGPRVVAALESVLSDPEDYVRVAVIQALRQLGSYASIPRFIEGLRDGDYFVRIAARGALEALSGERMGFDADASPTEREAKAKAWERWWDENKARLLRGR